MMLPPQGKKWALISFALGVLLIVLGVAFMLFPGKATGSFALAPGEAPAWDALDAPFLDNEQAKARGESELATIGNALAEEEVPRKYELLVGRAQYQELLGNGQAAYDDLLAAIAENPDAPLAYHNLGILLARAKAPESAARALQIAADKAPRETLYQSSYLSHLVQSFPEDAARIDAAYAFAKQFVGDTADYWTHYATYLTSAKRYAEAVAAWKEAKARGNASPFVDEEIARLEALR